MVHPATLPVHLECLVLVVMKHVIAKTVAIVTLLREDVTVKQAGWAWIVALNATTVYMERIAWEYVTVKMEGPATVSMVLAIVNRDIMEETVSTFVKTVILAKIARIHAPAKMLCPALHMTVTVPVYRVGLALTAVLNVHPAVMALAVYCTAHVKMGVSVTLPRGVVSAVLGGLVINVTFNALLEPMDKIAQSSVFVTRVLFVTMLLGRASVRLEELVHIATRFALMDGLE